MKSIKQIFLLAIGLCLALSLQAQPKREFRAAWLTTVWAIDWPTPHSQANASGQDKQQASLIAIIDSLATANMNAVFFQVRGFSDAMYNSKYEPWSKYLTGTRGKAPNYDPLQLIIDYAHTKGIEVHAWVNPYRYASSNDTYGKCENDYHYTHPEWLVKCGDITILNPSLPEVRKQICCVIADMVGNYDLDGVIFDDYFYQSGYQNSYDDAQYNAHKEEAGAAAMTRADWRRAQVNLMVREVRDTIKTTKPWVTFGIGPAGVAGKANTSAPVYGVEPCPSPSSDWQYNGIYSDPLAWYNEKTIDYMAPQIYWTIDSYTNYELLAKWWSDMGSHFGRHMYVSHSLSDLKADHVSIANSGFHADEIGAQTELNRKFDRMDAPGSCWYGLGTGLDTKNFIQYIKKNVYTNPSVVPQMSWYHSDECIYVSNIRTQGNILMWDAPKTNLRYIVYALPQSEVGKPAIIGSSEYLLGTTYTTNFEVETLPAGYVYAVAVLDRLGNEYPARTMDNTNWGKSGAATLVYPADKAATLMPCDFSWHPVKEADSYFFQLSKSADFSTLDFEHETVDTTFYIGKIHWLASDDTYYWRVRTRSINKEDTYSATYAFDGSYFKVVSPAEGDTTTLTPTFVCDSVRAEKVEYTFEVANRVAFDEDDILFSAITNKPYFTMPDSVLMASRNYYVRVHAVFGNAKVVSNNVVKFRTNALPVPVPEITSPKNGDCFAETFVTITWKEQNSSGFQIELAQKDNFPARSTKKYRVDPYVYTYTTPELKAGVWYVRVKAAEEEGLGEASAVVSFTLGADPTAVEDINATTVPVKIIENGQVIILRNGKRYNLLGGTVQ